MTNYLWDSHILCFNGSFFKDSPRPTGWSGEETAVLQLQISLLYFLYLSWNAFKSIFREGAPSHQANHHHQVFSPRFEPGRLNQLHQVDQEDVGKQYLGRFSRDQVDFFCKLHIIPPGWYPLDNVSTQFDVWQMTNPNVAEPLRLQSSRPSSCFQSNNPSSTFLKL